MKHFPVEKYQHTLARELLAPVLSESGWLQDALLVQEPDTDAREKMQMQLAIYRNNVMYSLTQAMAAQFPIIKKVVGDSFFLALARDYIQASPPQQPMLTLIGDTFPAFINTHEHCKALPYLHDLAKLEWLCQKALHAADDPDLDLLGLAGIEPEQLASGLFKLHDSASLLSSPFPVFRIWEENCQDNPDLIDLSTAEPTFALVFRFNLEVRVINLDERVFDLLYFIKQDMNIGDSWASVSSQHDISDDELPGMLSWLLGLGIFTEIQFRNQGASEWKPY